MTEKRIEDYFLKTILRISCVGTSFVVLMDILFMKSDVFFGLSGMVDVGILAVIIIAMILHGNGYYMLTVIIPTTFSSAALFVVSILHSQSATTAMIALVSVGFSISVLLKGKYRNLMHALIYCGMTTVFIMHLLNYNFYLYTGLNHVIITFAAYYIVYLIITYSAGELKSKYDSVTIELKEKNVKLLEQTVLMVHHQNELMESKNELDSINQNLEQIIEERTQNVKLKNEYLIKYAFANAHHVRGPLARILGLIQLSKLETNIDYPFLFNKIEDQAKEIDVVLKTINKELEEGQDVFF